MITLVLLVAAGAGASTLASPPSLFQRAEPSLAAGAHALSNGDVDDAIEQFRRAQPDTDDERAIVEYDVGAALLARAVASLDKGAAGGAPQHANDPLSTAPAAGAVPPAAESAPPDTDDARAAFERAYGIAKNRPLKSEAALAAGNAAAFAAKLDDAIEQYRKALVADPTNARAKSNLRRALEAKRAQPPPPPQQDGDNQDKGGGDNQGDRQHDNNKQEEAKKPDDHTGDEKQDQAKPDDDKGGDENKKLKKEDARRVLEMMRARERPLTPMEMRGQQQSHKPQQGKDW